MIRNMFNLLYQLLDLRRDDRIKHKAPTVSSTASNM